MKAWRLHTVGTFAGMATIFRNFTSSCHTATAREFLASLLLGDPRRDSPIDRLCVDGALEVGFCPSFTLKELLRSAKLLVIMNNRTRLPLVRSWQRDRLPGRRRMATASRNAADYKTMLHLCGLRVS